MEEKKKGLKTWHVILLVIAIIVVPYVLIFGMIFVTSYIDNMHQEVKFATTDDNFINIEKSSIVIDNNATVEVDNEDKCYNLIIKVENTGEQEVPFLDLQYNLYDADGYIIDSPYNSIQNVKPGKKYKLVISYCGIFYNKVDKYELNNISKDGYMH